MKPIKYIPHADPQVRIEIKAGHKHAAPRRVLLDVYDAERQQSAKVLIDLTPKDARQIAKALRKAAKKAKKQKG